MIVCCVLECVDETDGANNTCFGKLMCGDEDEERETHKKGLVKHKNHFG